MKKSVGFVCAVTLILSGFAAQAASGYHLIKSIPIPGDWTWDYIGMDSAHRHVLVSHGPELEILNADTYRIDGKIVAPDADFSKPETLAVMDVRGRTVALLQDARVPAGIHDLAWDGRDPLGMAATGVYFITRSDDVSVRLVR
jgi:hypothetical protein